MNETVQRSIEELAQKLGVSIENLWHALLQQAPISGGVGLVFDAVLFMFLFSVWKRLPKFYLDFNMDDREFLSVLASYTVFGIAFPLIVIHVTTSFPIHLAGVLNPEYWALKEILQ